jgi:hypothetical protein
MGIKDVDWNRQLFLFPVLFILLMGFASALVEVIPSSIDLDLCPIVDVPVNVTISDVEDVYGYQFDLSYNQSILEFINITDGGFLDTGGECDFCFSYTSVPSSGLIDDVLSTLVGSSSPSSSSGVLAKIVFRTRDSAHVPPTSSLRLLNVQLSDVNSTPLDNTAHDSTITVTACPCVEDWECTDYGDCIDSLRTRVCTDNNYCGTEDDKPAESESCTVGDNGDGGDGGGGSSGSCLGCSNTTACVPSWICSVWSECASTGTRTRTCSDIKNCNSTANKPATSEACTYVPEVNLNQQTELAGQAQTQEDLDAQAGLNESDVNVKGELDTNSIGLAVGLIAIIFIIVFLVVSFARKARTPGSKTGLPGARAAGKSPSQQESPDNLPSGQEIAADEYIRDCLAKDYTLSQIRDALIGSGWDPAKVDEMLKRFR